MSSSDSYYIDLLNNSIVYIYRYGSLVIYILGNVGNMLNALVFFKKSWRKNVCVVYFKFCLFLSLVNINSVMLGTILSTSFNINLYNSNVFLCKLYFYIPLVVSMLLPTILVLASIDRLLISSQNVDTRLYSSKRLAYFSMSISSFFWIVFNFHILIKVNIQVISPSILICYYDPSKMYADFVFYSLMTFNSMFCLLMIILSLLSLKNVRRMRAIPREQRQHIRSMTKKDFQLLRCLFFLDVAYIIISILPSVYSIYATATGYYEQSLLGRAIDSFLKSLFFFCYFVFYDISFFIYLGVSKAFRHELKRMIYKLFGQHLLPLQGEEDKNRQRHHVGDKVNVNIVVVSTIVPPTLIIE